MDLSNCKQLRFFGVHLNFFAAKCVVLVVIALFIGTVLLPTFSGLCGVIQQNTFVFINNRSFPSNQPVKQKFLEVPQIVWGLNNQKIAFARACFTARMLNRTLLMPKLSASLFYKEVELLKPISFDKVFQFERFNSLCKGFVQLSRYSDVSNQTDVIKLQKGSGRRWTLEKDLEQLNQFNYAKAFERLALVEEISREADKVVSKIRDIGMEVRSKVPTSSSLTQPVHYVAVHMRIEKDWMIHYTLLEDDTVLNGWKDGLLPFEKKKLGNSFSTFSSLVDLDRSQKMIKMGETELCGSDVRWPSYAYNIRALDTWIRMQMTGFDSSLKFHCPWGTDVVV
ncbi:hypothetical protein RND71_020374 [Anisodus tanguticus]|uniref:O-fucosyltransferase family protein n=1 Tax=Anisodus tanguticus TaxID=243964 RepID=A0AAE1S1C0_9SOLA|nr:hypothetical protein RND71_020374 [Anisodus tanguticus]